jgi:hypothetical protein
MEDTAEMTIREAADTALMIQNAANLSGVAHTFAEVLSRAIWPEAHRIGEGTFWVNSHPIATLFISKMSDLNGAYCSSSGFKEAYEKVERLASGQ